MNDDSFSTRLRNLSKDYYQNHIGFNEYRATRKSILDQIDEEFNGHQVVKQKSEEQVESSMFMQTVAFFANTDLLVKDKDKSD